MHKQMQELLNNVEERAILVSLVIKDHASRDSNYADSLQELIRLAETAGVEVLDTMSQSRERKDTRWLIGKGKVEELKLKVEEEGANTVIFDQELSGAQVRNLERALPVRIIDRTQLILDIFAQRANTREGSIQVELAQLSYLLPRLSGHGIHLSKLGGGIGTRGPGETKLETDRRHIRNRIHELQSQLKEVVKHRNIHRKRRKDTGVFQVALVGYTNAGKSTLLNQLTNAEAYVEDKLFATLDPLSRTLELTGGKEVVITDTVGFIRNLPHDLVAAFRATLEEVCEADFILHVVDASAEMFQEQMDVVEDVLVQLGAQDQDQITIFNKVDLCTEEQLSNLSTFGDSLQISAYEISGLEKVKQAIEGKLKGDRKAFSIPADRGELISLLYRTGEVIHQEIDQEMMVFQVRVNKLDYEKVKHRLEPFEQIQGSRHPQ